MRERITYTDGYIYQLHNDYTMQTVITGHEINTPLIALHMDGILTIRRGYAWDGASGPTINTRSSMRGSLVHDALYQLMRLDLIGQHNRKYADAYLRDICIADGMCKWRAWLWYHVVRLFAMPAANAENDRKIYTAPK